jgi:hypothetical protein
MRLILYVFLGFIISGKINWLLFLLDTLFVTGGIFFASLLNDYYDYRLLGEKNTIGKMLESGKLSRCKVLFLTWSPCLLPALLFPVMLKLGASLTSMILLTASFILCVLYCQPPFRLKKRPVLGLLAPPIGIFFLYLQALFLLNTPGRLQLLISVVIFIYSWYLEFMHLADDSTVEHEIIRLPGKWATKLAKTALVFGLLFSVFASFLEQLMVVSVIYWSVRLIFIFRFQASQIASCRKNLFSAIYSIEEFAIYAIVSLITIAKSILS